MAEKKKDEGRDVFETALDIALPVGITGAAMLGSRKVFRGIARKAIKADDAERAAAGGARLGPRDPGPMTKAERAQYLRDANVMGTGAGALVGVPVGYGVYHERQERRKKK